MLFTFFLVTESVFHHFFSSALDDAELNLKIYLWPFSFKKIAKQQKKRSFRNL
jgi:hypothetical protein